MPHRSTRSGQLLPSRMPYFVASFLAGVIVVFLLGCIPLSAPAQCTNAPTNLPFTNAAWQPLVSSPPNTWVNNYPPNAAAGACTACPTLYTHANACEGNRVVMYMCASNVYTISLCASSNTAWNSYITVTNTGTTSYQWDDNGCSIGGLSTLTFIPPTSGTYLIRISGPPPGCSLTTTNCGTLEITCSIAPPPPTNDNPCTATALSVGTACSMIPTGTAWATATAGIPAPGCGVYPNNYDVWYSAVVPASGNLAIETSQVGATNIAMALYRVTTPCPTPTGWTLVTCNDNIAVGSPEPYILQTGLTGGTTVYIRVWPEGNLFNGGTFEICAYEPVVPTNDQPCSATTLGVTPACTPLTGTTQNATATTPAPPAPTCGNVPPVRDVWYTLTTPVVAPPSTGVIINTASSDLTDAAMAVYTGTCGALTQVACSDPAGSIMPSVTLTPPTVPQGTQLWVRIWNKTTVFGNFTICAKPTSPPPNDDPCGAIALTPQYGCLYAGQTMENATQTPLAPVGTVNVPTAPLCGGTPFNDVWFTSVVPPNGQLIIDTDDGLLTDAALEIYRRASGSCATNNLNLVQIGAGGCTTGGSANNASMPLLNMLTGLIPGETVYIRVWRQTGVPSSFSICASRTDDPAGGCVFDLRMTDSGGDGWNGSTVTVGIYVGGIAPPVLSPPYTIIGSTGSVSFAASPGDIIEITYTGVGGFQSQNAYSVFSPNGGLLPGTSGSPPPPLWLLNVDNLCNNPPFPQEDCVGAVQVCNNSTLNATPVNTGAVDDLGPANRGCLITDERQGVWYRFYVAATGDLAFSVGPGTTDYDYGVWGPFGGGVTCPPNQPPLRCSWADGAAVTGLNYTATDITEGVFGDGWTRYIDVNAGEWYLIFLDNWYLTNTGFTMNWNLQGGASISCSLAPLTLVDLQASAMERGVQVDWVTVSERNTSHFIVERSGPDLKFTPIGRTEAAGNSFGPISYQLIDRTPLNGVNNYRLISVDVDGQHEVSATVSVTYDAHVNGLHIAPNPADGRITISWREALKGAIAWAAYDANGRVPRSGTQVLAEGSNHLGLDVSDWTSGVYQVVIRDGSGVVLNGRLVKH